MKAARPKRRALPIVPSQPGGPGPPQPLLAGGAPPPMALADRPALRRAAAHAREEGADDEA
eukprot:5260905-Alexandrium_andersonii.AAC.1